MGIVKMTNLKKIELARELKEFLKTKRNTNLVILYDVDKERFLFDKKENEEKYNGYPYLVFTTFLYKSDFKLTLKNIKSKIFD